MKQGNSFRYKSWKINAEYECRPDKKISSTLMQGKKKLCVCHTSFFFLIRNVGSDFNKIYFH